MDKKLENEIKIFMAEKIAAGVSLSDIQNMVNAEFKQNLTYMDIRIMASELEIDWQQLNPKKETAVEDVTAVEAGPQTPETPADENTSDAAAPGMPDLSDTKIEVSKIARPGMMFSGSVTFANGSSAEWYLDNMGRLGLENLQGDKPGQEDIEKFQIALQLELRKLMGQ